MTCKICAWLCNWLCADAGPVRSSFWRQSDAWESAHSNEYELWSKVTAGDRERIDAAKAIQDADPKMAFRIYLDLADAGVVWAMETVASHYELGIAVAADFEQAQTHYRRAIEAGSWMATIRYVKLLAHNGYSDICETLLQDGVKADFVPAFFWLAWHRLKRSSSRKTCREVRPLLEHAAEAGHPAAELSLARLQALGKFGLGEIPLGFKQISKIVGRNRSGDSSSESEGAPAGVGVG